MSLEDYHLLRKRFEDEVFRKSHTEVKSFKNVPRLFATNPEKDAYNISIMSNMRDHQTNSLLPVAKIPAKIRNANENSTQPDKDDVLYVCKGAKIMLRQNLWTEQGLVNGSVGEVVDVIYHPDATPQDDQASVLMCRFDSYTGPYLDPEFKTIPIVPVKKSICDNKGNYCVIQFPVVLNYACTIHKSQGLTMENAYIDLGPRGRPALHVLLFPERSLNGLLLKPFRIHVSNINHSAAVKRRQEWLRNLQNNSR